MNRKMSLKSLVVLGKQVRDAGVLGTHMNILKGSKHSKTRFLLFSCLMTALAVASEQIAIAQPVDLNMEDGTVNELSGPIDATSYLSSYGITVTNMTSGSTLYIEDTRWIYGGNVVIASSPYNVLVLEGSAGPESYKLDFSSPVTNISFYRVGFTQPGPNGDTFPEWSATLYSGSTQVSSIGEALFGTWSSRPQLFSLSGSGNRLVINSNDYNWAGFRPLVYDDLSYTLFPSPPRFCCLASVR
jgi:hypothetical protein